MMPGGGGGDVNTTLPMILSVVATLFCCLPAGVAGIVFASQASTALNAGDYVTAQAKAKTSMTIAIASLALGAIGYILMIVVNVIGLAANSH